MRRALVILRTFTRTRGRGTTRSSAQCADTGWCRGGGACLVFLATTTLFLTGCSSSSNSRAKASAIVVGSSSTTSGRISALAVASSLKLSMMPTGDSLKGGVDWVVACGGSPITGSVSNGACGTLSPVHTPDGQATTYTAPSVVPINGSVTITATVTSNPSQNASMSFTIVAAPIGVAFSTAAVPIPVSLQVNTTFPLNGQVTNDPLNAGVIYTATCGSSACGSFNPQTSTSDNFSSTYTAPSEVPAGNSVTITATSLTDTTKSASATLTITIPSQPPAVTVSVLPSNLYVESVGSVRTTHLVASVTNDPSNAGVDWSLQCGASACGTITPHTASGAAATYVAPSQAPATGAVTITATSTVNPAVSGSANANIVASPPIVVAFSTSPSPSLSTGQQLMLTATAVNDAQKLGINWAVSCGGAGDCGSFSVTPAHTASAGQIRYTAPTEVPSDGIVVITATSPATSPSNPAVAVLEIVAQPPSVSLNQALPAAMMSTAQIPVSATVANDAAPGGVSWSAQCSSTVPGGCGWFFPAQTASGSSTIYTAPPVSSSGTAVTITATSIANPAASASSGAIAVNPYTTPSVSFIPSLPAQMQPNATVNLEAAVANDTSDAGVDWQVCASGCGFFTVKPAVPAIPATNSTPYVPPQAAVTATSVSGWSDGLPIPYTAPSRVPSSGTVAILASAHAYATKATSGAIAIRTSPGGPDLSGVVQAGAQPVIGASVSLYAAGTGGYASAATQIGTTTTDKSGNFTLPGGYLCPSSASQMYVVATSGEVGSNNPNPNLAMMTSLGSCSNLGSTPVVVNEVTTVASAYATAPFAANDALTGNVSYLYLGTSSGNSAGLINTFAAANNLVDITTGQAKFVVPAGNAAVPYVAINTLADMLHSCTATAGGVEGDGSACGVLFSATDVLQQHTLYGSAAPTDTLQAVFNIAQHPIGNYGYLLNLPNLGGDSSLASTSSPFQPILASTPNDWSLSLNYTVGDGPSSADTLGSFAIDAVGNLWISDTTAGSVLQWNSSGASISPPGGYRAGGGPIAIDSAGNIWTSDNNSLNEMTGFGIAAAGSPFGGVPGGGSDIAIDADDNVWIANGAGVSEFSNLGVALSPPNGYINSAIPAIQAISIDATGNVWVGMLNSSPSSFAILSNPGGQFIVSNLSNSSGNIFPEMAADSAGHMWAVSQRDVCNIAPYAGVGAEFNGSVSCTHGGGALSEGWPFDNARGIALDGAGTIWVADAGDSTVPLLPGVLPIIPGGPYAPQGYYASPSLAAGPTRVGVDGSGNIWVLLANNTITEYVGAAAPTVNPTALALKSKKLGAKP